MAWRPRSTTISKNSETSPISAYPIPLTIFQPAKNGDFLTGGNILGWALSILLTPPLFLP